MAPALSFFPALRKQTLPRPRIVAHALSGSPALVLLKAGGGAGKSIAASHIATEFVRANQSSEQSAERAFAVWVRMTPDDNSETAFWLQVVSTIDRADLVPNHSTMRELVRGGFASATRDIIASAFAEMPAHLLVVIDDAHHALTPQVEESLVDVMASISTLSVVVATRRTPSILTSTSTRLKVPVKALTSDDLAFTEQEIADLAELRVPELSATHRKELARQNYRITKGWPIAVDALIMENHLAQDPASTWRPGSFVRDYVDRLLSESDPSAREVLFASSLFEEVTLDLLAHMLEQPVEHIEALIDKGTEDSFGYWIDDSRVRWYRHQELIRVELGTRANSAIEPAALQRMYQRAAEWLEMIRPDYAKVAAINAGAWDLLTRLLVTDLEISFHRRREHVWMEKIPSTVREQYPVIGAFALLNEYAFPSGKYRQMVAGLRLLASRTLAKESAVEGITGLVAATIRMIASRLGGLGDLATQLTDRVQHILEQFPSDDAEELKHVLEVSWAQLVVTQLHLGRFSKADAVLEHFLASTNPLRDRNQAHGTALAAWSHAWQGHMQQAQSRFSEGQALSLPLGWQSSYLGAGYRIAGAVIALEQDRLNEAQGHLDALSEHESTIEHWPFLTYISTLLAESRKGPGEALSFLDEQLRRREGRSRLLAHTARMLETLRMRLAWQSGQILAKSKRNVRPDAGVVYTALSRGENDIALGLSLSASRLPVYAGNHRARAELLLLQAESARRLGKSNEVAESAELAASLMADHGLVLPMRSIPHESAHALATLVPSLPVAYSSRGTARAIEPLTPAELSALQAVIQAGSVRAAADQLFLSPSTVKSYIKHAYRKLGVNSRSEAIRVASEAQLFTVHAENPLRDQ